MLLFRVSGVPNSPGRVQAANPKPGQSVSAVPLCARNPAVPHHVPPRPLGVRQELGQGRENRGCFFRQFFQGGRAGHLQRIHQQFQQGHGIGEDGEQEENCLR